MPIPRKIHYCWFGNGEKSELVQRCIASWKKYAPGCEIVEWNERNYDVTKNEYMYQAYQARRWGFVSDYARLDIVYSHGGIYLDTDVELIRNIEKLFDGDGFMGFETITEQNQKAYSVNTGQGFGAPARHELIKKMMDIYAEMQFVNEDGSQNLQPCPFYNTKVLVQNGIKRDNTLQIIEGITIYPFEYFCPMSWKKKNCDITDNTYSIHHFDASWLSDDEKKQRKRQRKKDSLLHMPNRIAKKILGEGRYEKLKQCIKK